jgi:hypothetical protein
MDVVVDTPGDVELLSARMPGDAVEGVRHPQDLALDRYIAGDVVNEDILVRLLRDTPAGRVVGPVIAARQDEERVAVGADGGGHGLTGEEIGIGG